jgi:hypothetical protein
MRSRIARDGGAAGVAGLRREVGADDAGQATDHKQQRQLPYMRDRPLADGPMSDRYRGDAHQTGDFAVVQAEAARRLEDRWPIGNASGCCGAGLGAL